MWRRSRAGRKKWFAVRVKGRVEFILLRTTGAGAKKKTAWQDFYYYSLLLLSSATTVVCEVAAWELSCLWLGALVPVWASTLDEGEEWGEQKVCIEDLRSAFLYLPVGGLCVVRRSITYT